MCFCVVIGIKVGSACIPLLTSRLTHRFQSLIAGRHLLAGLDPFPTASTESLQTHTDIQSILQTSLEQSMTEDLFLS